MTSLIIHRSRFAWYPVKIQSSWVWLRKFTERVLVKRSEHGCNDCHNPLTPCDGPQWDFETKVLSRHLA